MESKKGNHENSHIPNEETIKALKESLRGEGIESYSCLEEMWSCILSEEDFGKLMYHIHNPEKPNEKLKSAFNQYKNNKNNFENESNI